jgi:hypothetical protein
VGLDALKARLAESSELEALIGNALETATRTDYAAKRRLLARVVINAALDDAKIDESQLIEMALRDLEAVHIRALQRIVTAEDATAVGSEDEAVESTRRMKAAALAAQKESDAVVAALIRIGTAVPPGGGYAGGPIVAITRFGRRLLDELRELGAADEETERLAT